MFCTNCSKLTILNTKKKCIRCQGEILNNISVLCDFCSLRDQICAACLKKVNKSTGPRHRGCNCGK